MSGNKIRARREAIANAVGRRNREGNAVEELSDRVDLRSLHHRFQLSAVLEWQEISRARHKAIGHVQFRVTIVALDVVRIHYVPRTARAVIERVAVGVGSQEAQITSAAFAGDLHRVVAGKLVGLERKNLGEKWIG